ncbi:MAG: hypothetical protein LBP65_00980 [Puniceicoccales bacterium]|jgi:hypothetical protein|nr:hypothetical protein [Puniceicoccales bacterium]
MSGKWTCGVHSNGVVDTWVCLSDDGVEGRLARGVGRTCRWPLLIDPSEKKSRREMSIAGPEAERSLVGSGLFLDAAICRAGSRRREVQKLWQDYAEAAIFSENVAKSLAQHLRVFVPREHWADLTMAIPDSWKDTHQEALLRTLSPRPKLLWNSVAAFLGVVADMAERPRWDGKNIAVLYGALRGVSMVKLRAKCVIQSGQTYLVPTRSGGGVFIPFELGDLATHITADCSTAWEREHLLRRHLQNWCGPLPPNGDLWRRLRLEFQKVVEHISREKVDGVILSGPLFHLRWEGSSAAEEFQKILQVPQLRRRLLFDCVAFGAALYGRYLKNDLPTYFDSVPRLEINAIRRWQPAFITLAREQTVAGGKAYESDPLPGFKIRRGESQLAYYLCREDEVRKLTKTLPYIFMRDMGVSLRVIQRPAQGFAQVLIEEQRTDGPANSYRGFHAKLDWQAMENTGKTRKEVLENLCNQFGRAFPPCNPIRALFTASQRFRCLGPLEYSCIKSKLSNRRWRNFEKKWEWLSGSVVGSDGDCAPENREWLETFLRESAKDFCTRKKMAAFIENDSGNLFMCWSYCYAAAPEEFLEHMRRSFESFIADPTISIGRHTNYAGRCFHKLADMQLFFRAMERRLQAGIEGTNNWLAAFINLFQFRENAQSAMSHSGANFFAKCFLRILRREMEKKTICVRFMNALRAFAALLRYRLEQEDFLVADNPIRIDVRGLLHKVLNGSYAIMARRRKTIEEMLEFLECRGTNALFFKSSEEGEDSD